MPSKLPGDGLSCLERVITDGTGSIQIRAFTHLSAFMYEDACPNSEGEFPASLTVLTGGPLFFYFRCHEPCTLLCDC